MQTSTPASDTVDSNTPTEPPALGGLYEHSSRPDWGLATRVANDDGRSAYQFEDGKLRKIAGTHEELMKEVSRPYDEAMRVQRELAAMAGTKLARQDLRNAGHELISLDQQVQLFAADFPGGFEDEAWVKQHRGVAGKRAAKRHRDAAIERANEQLGRKALLGLMVASGHTSVMERVVELLKSTSLVTKKQLEPLTGLDETAQRRVVAALGELLHGDVETAVAMQNFVDALRSSGKAVSWSLVTAIAALLKPQEHVCVRASVFTLQLAWMAPRVRLPKPPSGRSYVRACEVALQLSEELTARGYKPRDLLDVYDFMWWTLRPAARKRIAVMPPAPTAGPNDDNKSNEDGAERAAA